MAKITFKESFTLEVGDEIYTGTLNDLSKNQKQEFEKVSKKAKAETEELQKLLRKTEKIDRKIFIAEKLEKWEDISALETEKEAIEAEQEKILEALQSGKNIENIFKKRLELSIVSDDIDKIMEAGEEHGYQNVFNTIMQDIDENRKKK